MTTIDFYLVMILVYYRFFHFNRFYRILLKYKLKRQDIFLYLTQASSIKIKILAFPYRFFILDKK